MLEKALINEVLRLLENYSNKQLIDIDNVKEIVHNILEDKAFNYAIKENIDWYLKEIEKDSGNNGIFSTL